MSGVVNARSRRGSSVSGVRRVRMGDPPWLRVTGCRVRSTLGKGPSAGRILVARPYNWNGPTQRRQAMAKHAPRFLKIVNEARSRIRETNVGEVKKRLD